MRSSHAVPGHRPKAKGFLRTVTFLLRGMNAARRAVSGLGGPCRSALFLEGEEGPSEEERGFWERKGVRVEELPPLSRA